MATVRDLSGNSPIGSDVDNKLEEVNVYNAGDPTGSVTPNFSGELLFDTTNEIKYKAEGTTSTSWVRVV
jgi:hypothetical protein